MLIKKKPPDAILWFSSLKFNASQKHLIFFPHENFVFVVVSRAFSSIFHHLKTPKKKIIWRIRKSIKCQKAKCWTFFSSRISFHPPTLPIHVFFIYIFYGCLSHWKCMFFSKWRSCWFCLGCWKEDPYIYIYIVKWYIKCWTENKYKIIERKKKQRCYCCRYKNSFLSHHQAYKNIHKRERNTAQAQMRLSWSLAS